MSFVPGTAVFFFFKGYLLAGKIQTRPSYFLEFRLTENPAQTTALAIPDEFITTVSLSARSELMSAGPAEKDRLVSTLLSAREDYPVRVRISFEGLGGARHSRAFRKPFALFIEPPENPLSSLFGDSGSILADVVSCEAQFGIHEKNWVHMIPSLPPSEAPGLRQWPRSRGCNYLIASRHVFRRHAAGVTAVGQVVEAAVATAAAILLLELANGRCAS